MFASIPEPFLPTFPVFCRMLCLYNPGTDPRLDTSQDYTNCGEFEDRSISLASRSNVILFCDRMGSRQDQRHGNAAWCVF